MSKTVLKDLSELVNAGIITSDTADKILQHYQKQRGHSQHRLLIAFGIVGTILVGLGIILMIAHNWDEFSRAVKTGFAFLPLIMGQILCAYVLIKKEDSTTWRESTATFLFFSVGASISLVSEIYHMQGDLSLFVLTWVLLCLPLIYVLRSSIVSLLYIISLTYYACEKGYWGYSVSIPYEYWLLLVFTLPHYYILLKHKPSSNFTIFHHWIIPLSVIIALGAQTKAAEELMFVAYMSLLGLLYLTGKSPFFEGQKSIYNAYLLLGSLGTMVILLFLSFSGFWQHIHNQNLFSGLIATPEFFVSVFISLTATVLLYEQYKRQTLQKEDIMAYAFIVFMIIFVVGSFSALLSVMMINVLVLSISILTIRDGAKKNRLGVMNYGLLIITALIICRFFDIQISFVLRGLLFVLVGVGFFLCNYRMLKRRKTSDVTYE